MSENIIGLHWALGEGIDLFVLLFGVYFMVKKEAFLIVSLSLVIK